MKSLLKAWEKFESSLNRLFGRLGKQLSSRLQKLGKPKEKTQVTSPTSTLSFKERAKLYAQQVTPKIKARVVIASKTVSGKVNGAIKTVQSIDRKQVAPKALATAFMAFLIDQGSKIKYWYLSIRPEVFLGYTIATTVVTVSSLNIYKATQSISKTQDRSPAQIAQMQVAEGEGEGAGNIPPTPKIYNNIERRQMTLYEVVVPVLIESEVGIKSLLIDMEIQTSNRYSRELLYRKEYLVKDRLNKNLRPIIPEFPLTDEGKRILKEKIKRELDALLKDLEIEGHIEDVSFIYIMAA